MFKNMANFMIYFVIFGIAYGISTQELVKKFLKIILAPHQVNIYWRSVTDPDKALLYPNEWRPREVFYGFVYVPLFSIYGEIFNGERNSYGHAESLEPGEDCVITTNKVRFRSISGWISGLKFDIWTI